MSQIMVNGTQHEVTGVITYAKACALAFFDPLFTPSVEYTHVSGTGGMLGPDDRIIPSEGLVLRVTPRGKSVTTTPTSELTPEEVAVARGLDKLAVDANGLGTVPTAWLTEWRRNTKAR